MMKLAKKNKIVNYFKRKITALRKVIKKKKLLAKFFY